MQKKKTIYYNICLNDYEKHFVREITQQYIIQ